MLHAFGKVLEVQRKPWEFNGRAGIATTVVLLVGKSTTLRIRCKGLLEQHPPTEGAEVVLVVTPRLRKYDDGGASIAYESDDDVTAQYVAGEPLLAAV